MSDTKISAETRYEPDGKHSTQVAITAPEAEGRCTLAVASSKNGAPIAVVAEQAIAQLDARAADARSKLEKMGLVAKKPADGWTTLPFMSATQGGGSAPQVWLDNRTARSRAAATRPYISSSTEWLQHAVASMMGVSWCHVETSGAGSFTVRYIGSAPYNEVSTVVSDAKPAGTIYYLYRLVDAAEALKSLGVTEVTDKEFAENIEAIKKISKAMGLPEDAKPRPGDTADWLLRLAYAVDYRIALGSYRDAADGARVETLLSTILHPQLRRRQAEPVVVKNVSIEKAGLERLPLAGKARTVFPGCLSPGFTYEEMHLAGVSIDVLDIVTQIHSQIAVHGSQVSAAIDGEELIALRDGCFRAFQDVCVAKREIKSLREQLLGHAKEIAEARGACEKMRKERDTHSAEKRDLAEKFNKQTAELNKANVTIKYQTELMVSLQRHDANTGFGTLERTVQRAHPFRSGFKQTVSTYRKSDANGHHVITEVSTDVPPPNTKVVTTSDGEGTKIVSSLSLVAGGYARVKDSSTMAWKSRDKIVRLVREVSAGSSVCWDVTTCHNLDDKQGVFLASARVGVADLEPCEAPSPAVKSEAKVDPARELQIGDAVKIRPDRLHGGQTGTIRTRPAAGGLLVVETKNGDQYRYYASELEFVSAARVLAIGQTVEIVKGSGSTPNVGETGKIVRHHPLNATMVWEVKLVDDCNYVYSPEELKIVESKTE